MATLTIDFKGIKNENPAAFDAFIAWYGLSHTMSSYECEQMILGESTGMTVIHNRNLFEFFDAHKVGISVMCTPHPLENRFIFSFQIGKGNELNPYSSRSECEYYAFIEAFTQLETMITKADLV